MNYISKFNNLKLLCLIFFFLFPTILSADSPLTSTPFYKNYTDVNIVLEAEKLGTVNKEMADYLHNPNNPVDVKAALINALGWNVNGNNNAEDYCMIIYNRVVISNDMISVSTDEAFVIGYLYAMGNYLNPDVALPYLKIAKNNNPNSYTVNMIYYLTKAQKAMNTDFCKSWKYVNKVFLNDKLNMDMREDARKVIYDYMVIYKSYCK